MPDSGDLDRREFPIAGFQDVRRSDGPWHALSWLAVVVGPVAALLAPIVLTLAEFVTLCLVGAFAASFASMLSWSVSEGGSAAGSSRALVDAAYRALAGAILAVAAGVVVIGLGSYGWPVLVGSAASYALLYFLVRVVRSGRAGKVRSAPGAPPRDQGLCMPPFERCRTSELTASWVATSELLDKAVPPVVRARIVALRGGYLDELERRDPQAVQRWLGSSPDLTGDLSHLLGDLDEGGETEPGVH